MVVQSRIAPLAPPYAEPMRVMLTKMMGTRTDVEPLALFRTLARHADLTDRMRPLGALLLAHGVLAREETELVILRTCARCRCAYEWGVHAASLSVEAGLTPEQIAATVQAGSGDGRWSPRQALLVRLVDELHDTSRVGPELWHALAEQWSEPQLLELLMLCGFYHAISYVANGAQVQPEPWAAPFPGEDSAAGG
jgi:alkylhydroperoxidase family enzyme